MGQRDPLLGGDEESNSSSSVNSSPKSMSPKSMSSSPGFLKNMSFRMKYMALIGGLALVVVFSFLFFNYKEEALSNVEYYTNPPLKSDQWRQDIIIYFWDTPSVEQDKTGMLLNPSLKGPERLIDNDDQQQIPEQKQPNQQAATTFSNSNANLRKVQSLPDRLVRKRIPLKDRIAEQGDECEVSCLYSHHPDDLPYADYIVFDPSHLHPDNWRRMPVTLPEKHLHQKFVLLNHNSPSQFPIISDNRYQTLMDMHLNYTTKSPHQLSMACPPEASYKDSDIRSLLAQPTDLKARNNNVVFMSSNCANAFSKARTAYVADLMRSLPLDAVGDCLTNKARVAQPDSQDIFSRIQANIKVFKDYKFVITFENENTTDYVTEKVYSALFAGAIPVYMGASNIDDWVPTNSVIKASKFVSPKDLAAYLNELLQSPSMMDIHLEWKNKPIEDKVMSKFSKCMASFGSKCELCKMAYDQLSNDQYKYKEIIFGNGAHYQPYHLQLEGKGDYVEVKPSKDCPKCFDLTDHYTLMAWVKPNTFGDQRLIDKGTPGKVDGYDFDIQKTSSGTRGTVRLCAAGACFISHATISSDVWSHVAVVFSVNNPNPHDNNVNFYINGVKDLPNEFFNPTDVNSHPLAIGKSYGQGPLESGTYDGLIDNVAIFNRSLTEKEVQAAMWAKPNHDDKSLVLFLDFDNSIQTRNMDRKIAFDKSPYANHAYCIKGEKGDQSQRILSYGKEYAFNRCL